MTRFAFALLIFCLPLAVFAQSKEEAAYLIKSMEVTIKYRSETPEILEHFESEKIFYSNFGSHIGESVFYSDMMPVLSIEAETLPPANSNGKKMKVNSIETHEMMLPEVFYGGYKRKDFVFPNVFSGSIGRMEYTRSVGDLHFSQPFYFEDDLSVKEAVYTVTFPRNVVVAYHLFGHLKNKVQFFSQSDGERTRYTWRLLDIPASQQEWRAPSRAYYGTHLIVYIQSYELNGQKKDINSQVSDLYQWYTDLVRTIPHNDNIELDHLADDVTKGKTSDDEKARAVYKWVQKNIKYIAFEQGMAGIIPRDPGEVFAKRYGDCKDMANLLKYMLTHVGIESYLVWIGTRDKPYSYSDLPLHINNNHMICAYRRNGEMTFLDGTDPTLSFGTPSVFIQGKEALVGLTPSTFEIVKVPIRPAQDNTRTDSVEIAIEGNNLTGTVKTVLTGYKKEEFEQRVYRQNASEQIKYLRDYLMIGKDNIQLSNLEVTGQENADEKDIITFKYLQPEYAKNIGSKIYVNMNLQKRPFGQVLDTLAREQLIQGPYKFEDIQIYTMKVPEGYEVSNVPSDLAKDWPEFGVQVAYRVVANTIVLKKTLSSNYLYIHKGQFPQWNEFIKLLSASNLQTITLTRTQR